MLRVLQGSLKLPYTLGLLAVTVTAAGSMLSVDAKAPVQQARPLYQ